MPSRWHPPSGSRSRRAARAGRNPAVLGRLGSLGRRFAGGSPLLVRKETPPVSHGNRRRTLRGVIHRGSRGAGLPARSVVDRERTESPKMSSGVGSRAGAVSKDAPRRRGAPSRQHCRARRPLSHAAGPPTCRLERKADSNLGDLAMKLTLEGKGFLLGALGVVAIAATSLATALLAVALFLKSREPRPVVLVPGLDAPRVVDPGRVPDVLARDFALDFAIAFENYSPATIDRVAKFLRSRVAPELFGQFSQVLEKRSKLVSETGMVSQLLPNDPLETGVQRNSDRLEVTFPATRRGYIGGGLH